MQNIEHPLHHRIQKSLLSIVGVFRYSCYVKELWTRNQTSSPILTTVYRFVILSKPFNLSEASFSSRVCVCVCIHSHTCTHVRHSVLQSSFAILCLLSSCFPPCY